MDLCLEGLLFDFFECDPRALSLSYSLLIFLFIENRFINKNIVNQLFNLEFTIRLFIKSLLDRLSQEVIEHIKIMIVLYFFPPRCSYTLISSFCKCYAYGNS